MPNIPVIIYPTPVQGKGVAQLIANAINTANIRAECDVLIICRGGGSIEDLWQFNEEIVARAIANCSIPTVSGVGHETDFTICDFVADIRAATPTAAAELVTPSRDALLSSLNQLKMHLTRNLQFSLNQRAQALDYLARRLTSPTQQINQQKLQLAQITRRLQNAALQQLKIRQQNLLRLSQNLQHLNPQAVLTRGYAFVQDTNGGIVSNSDQLNKGDQVKLTFGIGSADAIINKVNS
jgi:exodeoxyribonuclease VII large subunit